MRKIGYIYQYNTSEGKGILVYGKWKDRESHEIVDLPVIFLRTNCLSDVCTGQLVYFELSGNNAINIERASLANFDKEVISNIISGRNDYFDNTNISFEDISDIIISGKVDENLAKSIIKECGCIEDHSIIDFDYILLSDDDISDISDLLITHDWYSKKSSDFWYGCHSNIHKHIILDNVKQLQTQLSELPNKIDDLFSCFGKYKHHWTHIDDYCGMRDTLSVDIFNMPLWIDIDFTRKMYFGKNAEEVKFLYDVFVRRMYYDKDGNIKYVEQSKEHISYEWRKILMNLCDDELKEVLAYAPNLQPVVPVSFCKDNLDCLSDEYGMPNAEICELQFLHKISNARTISDYEVLTDKLFDYRYCTTQRLEGAGTPMCKMGKCRLDNLEKRLEERYGNVIKPDIIAQIKVLSEYADIDKELQNLTHEEFDNVGLYLEHYNNLRTNFLEYEVIETVLKSYNGLPQLYKDALRTSLLNCANESAITATKADNLRPFSIGYAVNQLDRWILKSTKQQIKELVNERFSNLSDLEDLNDAYQYDYITAKQYYSRYKQLTSGFNSYQFSKEISDYKIKNSPTTIQWYVVSNIIKQLGYNSLNSYNCVRNDYDSICDIRSLLVWLKYYDYLKDTVLKKAEIKICSVLSNEERWTLFEEKIIESPGIENIRKSLDEAYIKKSIDKELLKYLCFQDMMLSDTDKVKDTEVLLFIADNLDNDHQYLMQLKSEGFLKLYLWQKQPSESFDWDLIKSHYHELPADVQIRTLRYFFGRISSGDSTLSLDTLYSEFVETSTPASSAICGILFLLQAKKNDMNASITPAMVESVIGSELKQRSDFLKDSKELFYPCNGYLATTPEELDTEYFSYYGILTKEIKNDALYYVITFYDSPVDLCGQTIDWMDSEWIDVAEQVLLRNASVEIVNDKYYIHESQEFFVKQFVVRYNIDDRCGLVNDISFKPLYTNYHKKYEDSNNYICRCGCFGDSDPNNSIPFFWCQKKICVRYAHFLLPPTQWEEYRFADLLYIANGQKSDEIEAVWRVNAEISQFICDYSQIYKSDERNINSNPLNENEERGVWDDESSTYRDIYDEDEHDDGEYDNGEFGNFPEYDEPTYDRYGGSYAQDVMGYSDDDIDTILDGDPDAYWNID